VTADWVPFHRSLVNGKKKAWPRAVRFVLMELSLAARATGGVLEFPPEWDTLTALHDLLGGDRRELRRALDLLKVRDELGQPTIEIDKDLFNHRLKIVKWREHAGPRRGSERTADWRDRKKTDGLAEPPRHTPLRPPADVTPTEEEKTVDNNTEEEAERARAPAAAPERPRVPDRSSELDAIIRELERWPSCDCLPIPEVAAMLEQRWRTNHLAKGTKLSWVLDAFGEAAADGVGLTGQALTKKLRSYGDHARAPRADQPSTADDAEPLVDRLNREERQRRSQRGAA